MSNHNSNARSRPGGRGAQHPSTNNQILNSAVPPQSRSNEDWPYPGQSSQAPPQVRPPYGEASYGQPPSGQQYHGPSPYRQTPYPSQARGGLPPNITMGQGPSNYMPPSVEDIQQPQTYAYDNDAQIDEYPQNGTPNNDRPSACRGDFARPQPGSAQQIPADEAVIAVSYHFEQLSDGTVRSECRMVYRPGSQPGFHPGHPPYQGHPGYSPYPGYPPYQGYQGYPGFPPASQPGYPGFPPASQPGYPQQYAPYPPPQQQGHYPPEQPATQQQAQMPPRNDPEPAPKPRWTPEEFNAMQRAATATSVPSPGPAPKRATKSRFDTELAAVMAKMSVTQSDVASSTVVVSPASATTPDSSSAIPDEPPLVLEDGSYVVMQPQDPQAEADEEGEGQSNNLG